MLYVALLVWEALQSTTEINENSSNYSEFRGRIMVISCDTGGKVFWVSSERACAISRLLAHWLSCPHPVSFALLVEIPGAAAPLNNLRSPIVVDSWNRSGERYQSSERQATKHPHHKLTSHRGQTSLKLKSQLTMMLVWRFVEATSERLQTPTSNR